MTALAARSLSRAGWSQIFFSTVRAASGESAYAGQGRWEANRRILQRMAWVEKCSPDKTPAEQPDIVTLEGLIPTELTEWRTVMPTCLIESSLDWL
jgi:hypothetical protein